MSTYEDWCRIATEQGYDILDVPQSGRCIKSARSKEKLMGVWNLKYGMGYIETVDGQVFRVI